MQITDIGIGRGSSDRVFLQLQQNTRRVSCTVNDKELENLPLFINVNLMENIVEHFEDMRNYGEELRSDEELAYLIKCLEDNIPYQGFFHEIYSSDAPFAYEACEI